MANDCTATTRAGHPCRRKRVRGSDKCQAHGGVVEQAVFDESKFKNRCTGLSTRSGERCRKPAINGGTVCRNHGGSLPTVKKAARDRFRELEEPMVDLAHKLMEKAAAGRMTDGDSMRLLSFIGDRLGYTRGVDVNHTVEVKPWEQTMQVIITEIPVDYDPFPAGIEDAEVIEESIGPVNDLSKLERFDGPRIGRERERRESQVRGSAEPFQRRTPSYD